MPTYPFSNDKSFIELFGKTISQSEKAVCIDFGDNIHWIPISQMEDYPDVGYSGSVLVKEWIAKDKGLI